MNKRISITREQVEKLLEMCKDSFPEYSHINFETRYGTNDILFDSRPDVSPDPHEYHWFELCVTELPRILLPKLDNFSREDELIKHPELASSYQSGGELLFFAVSQGLNVIDLLYKEYKKLKRWEMLALKELKKD